MKNQMLLTPYFLDGAVGQLEELMQEGWWLNKPEMPVEGQQERMSALYAPLAAEVQSAVQAGLRPVSIAGDCCATLAVVSGLQRAGLDPLLIWLDAHGDFNTWETTPSGFLGGMPLAWLVGRGRENISGPLGLEPLAEGSVILSDARDLDPGEAEAMRDSAVTHLPEVSLVGDYPLPERPLYVHFDVDVLRLQEVPAVSYPASGGPSAEQVRAVFKRLAGSGQLTAVSVSAWNPDLDGASRSRDVVLGLLDDLLA